ncbi:efflux RND transporter periplasmic adaptor subunit [Kordiimonas sp. SCSIO 12610]|uniref:efflux RND transporter periplasmic adaptor subunit n=1 Tax=Kordiimonas sp. SCSIO 12610 TaxID=2829597 RepID=UPI00210DB279|nr:efflux RND transporter periplasmic adaptor subunit [Kordiimonas sp. SCSIO 12610]UTW55769.1 efflux RND transporter periplasmic adaptor subunit [Kordiimonas sp. SCSIO 12610]
MSDKKDLLSQLSIDRDSEETKSNKTPLLLTCLLAGTIAVGGALFYFPDNAAEQPDQTIAKQSATLKPQTSTKAKNDITAPEPTPKAAVIQTNSSDTVLDGSGYITARRMATVSAELTGRITDVLVEEGMRVEEGQVLARLDDALAVVNLKLAKAQASAAQARILSAEANFREAERVLARVSKLQSNDFSSEARLTNSMLNVETSRAELARAKADYEVANLEVSRQQERLNDHTIRAPFGGVVTIKNAQPGEIVAPGSAGGGFTRTGICTIVDMASLEIEVDVNEAFIGRVSDGQKVVANLDAYPDWDIPASVIAIIPTANRDKATVRVRIRIETDDPRILPDMGVKVAFYRT